MKMKVEESRYYSYLQHCTTTTQHFINMNTSITYT